MMAPFTSMRSFSGPGSGRPLAAASSTSVLSRRRQATSSALAQRVKRRVRTVSRSAIIDSAMTTNAVSMMTVSTFSEGMARLKTCNE